MTKIEKEKIIGFVRDVEVVCIFAELHQGETSVETIRELKKSAQDILRILESPSPIV